MSKRPGSELINSSKRSKTNGDMHPPQYAPSMKAPLKPSNQNFNPKTHTSVADPKSSNANSDSDSDDEEIWLQASQMEQRYTAAMRNDEIDLTYSDFRTAEGPTSTQHTIASQVIPVIDLTRHPEPAVDTRVQILQNRCAALEKQLKKFKPSSAVQSQRANELSELREAIRKLSSENDELRREKLKTRVEAVDGESEKLKCENDKLKKIVDKLIKERRENLKATSSFANSSQATQIPTSSNYQMKKLAVWDDLSFKLELFRDKSDEEMSDLIRKTMDFNIFEVKSESFEEFCEKQFLESARNEKCQQKLPKIKHKSHLKKTTSAPQLRNITRSLTDFKDPPAVVKKFSTMTAIKASTQFDPIRDPYGILTSTNHSKISSRNQFEVIPEDSHELSTLKLIISRAQTETILKQPPTDVNEIFNEILKIISKIATNVREVESRRWNEQFTRQDFARKQAQYFSVQHFANLALKAFSECEIANLTHHERIFENELRVEERRLISLIAVICKSSREISEKILSQNIAIESGTFRTAIDAICEIIDPHILQSRLLYENSGLTLALSELIVAISSHYGEFSAPETVDEMLMKLFNHILTMSTCNEKILIKLTRFLVNVSTKADFGMISKLCIDFPSSQLEYSKVFKIYQIPRTGCLLQIYFLLVSNAFRYTENVERHRVRDLFELTMVFNTLVGILVSNEEKLKFLQPKGSEDSGDHCKCYHFLTVAVLTLNEQTLRHRNHKAKENLFKLRKIVRSGIINISYLFSLTRRTVGFWSFKFAHNVMNNIFNTIRYGQIRLDERTFNCRDVLLVGRNHDAFLKKLRVKTQFEDEEFSLLGISQEENDLNKSTKEQSDGMKKSLMDAAVKGLKADDEMFKVLG